MSSDCGSSSFLTSLQSELQNQSDTGNVQVTALTSQIGQLKVEIMRLNNQLELAKQAPFRIECIRHDKKLTSLYTGFPSYDVLMAFFKFLGPSVDRLQVWGTETKTQAKRRSKLDPLNQLFMTLVKLKLDLNIQPCVFRSLPALCPAISSHGYASYTMSFVRLNGFLPRIKLQEPYHLPSESSILQP